MTEPITHQEEIVERLMEVEVGDELTIETEFKGKINREVSHVEDEYNFEYNTETEEFEEGDPIDRYVHIGDSVYFHRQIYVDLDTQTAEVFALTDDPMNPLDSKGHVQKLWVWENDSTVEEEASELLEE